MLNFDDDASLSVYVINLGVGFALTLNGLVSF